MALKTPTLYGAEEDRISFGCAGEGCVVSCLLTSSPNYVNPVDKVLAQSEKAFAQQSTRSVGWITWSSWVICDMFQFPMQIR